MLFSTLFHAEKATLSSCKFCTCEPLKFDCFPVEISAVVDTEFSDGIVDNFVPEAATKFVCTVLGILCVSERKYPTVSVKTVIEASIISAHCKAGCRSDFFWSSCGKSILIFNFSGCWILVASLS